MLYSRCSRSKRRSRLFFAFCALPVACLTADVAVAATPSAKAALSLNPVQKEVEYDLVDADEVDQCSVRDIDHADWSGWEVVGPDGSVLRRFADTNGDKKIDLWCYFRYGVEVYRDIDGDFNGRADQHRWLGTLGIRWGIDDDENGTIDRWKQISAEEVSAEMIAAIRDADGARFARLLASPSELKSLSLGGDKTEELSVKAERAAREFSRLAERQKVVGPDAQWVQFASPPPGIVPAGTDGSKRDVIVYENAVAMFEDADGSGQILVGTIVRIGDAWRLVDLPSVGTTDDAVAQPISNFFAAHHSGAAAGATTSGIAPKIQELVARLEKIDATLSKTSDKKTLAGLHDQRAETVMGLVKASETADERATWTRQLIDMVSVATQNGAYPDGLARLRAISRAIPSDNKPLRAYADFQTIGTEYVTRQTPDADFAKVQEWYLTALTDFVDRFPRTGEAAQAMLQLALSKEFEDKEREALGYYKSVAKDFAGTDMGEKAAGAVRRLESVGRTIDLEGTTIDGKPFKLSALRGRPVVIHYWATWCEPCKQDMKLLRRLQARYQKAGLILVGINVDVTRELANGFLKETPLPWIQLFDDGGLEASQLAKAFGVQTLPTMMLVDKAGKVVRHNVRAAELDGDLEKMLTAKR
tara:strand:- start:202840 stop:204774 length:1935 start_codon:yes stop_codon:yes gene_type:complete